MHHRRGITVERFLHIVLVSAIVVLSLFLLNAVRDVLLPFVVALAIAYLMYPFMLRVQRVVRLRATTSKPHWASIRSGSPANSTTIK